MTKGNAILDSFLGFLKIKQLAQRQLRKRLHARLRYRRDLAILVNFEEIWV